MEPDIEWEEFFDQHAPYYMENVFTRNTAAEIEFILAELTLPNRGRILDVGCGTGRHAIELARRGFCLTGVDLSSGMLEQARQAAREAGVSIEWIHADAARFTAREPFDAAICLCEGSFGLLGDADDPLRHDLAILRNIHAALKPSAPFLLTALNGYRMIRQYAGWLGKAKDGLVKDDAGGSFDLITMVERSPIEVETPDGKRTFLSRERGYLLSELFLLVRLAGFEVEHIGGGTAGNWARRPLEPDEMEIMVIARKEP
jgi:SAM-dependent methyltransferase